MQIFKKKLEKTRNFQQLDSSCSSSGALHSLENQGFDNSMKVKFVRQNVPAAYVIHNEGSEPLPTCELMLPVLCPHSLRLSLTALHWLHLIFVLPAWKRTERKLLLPGSDLSFQEEVIWVTSNGVQVTKQHVWNVNKHRDLGQNRKKSKQQD